MGKIIIELITDEDDPTSDGIGSRCQIEAIDASGQDFAFASIHLLRRAASMSALPFEEALEVLYMGAKGAKEIPDGKE